MRAGVFQVVEVIIWIISGKGSLDVFSFQYKTHRKPTVVSGINFSHKYNTSIACRMTILNYL